MSTKHPIDRAAEVIGSQASLAGLLGVTRAAVGQWKLPDRKVPAEHCPSIERETRRIAEEHGDPAMVVTCEELRPDVAWRVLRDQPAADSPAVTAEAAHG